MGYDKFCMIAHIIVLKSFQVNKWVSVWKRTSNTLSIFSSNLVPNVCLYNGKVAQKLKPHLLHILTDFWLSEPITEEKEEYDTDEGDDYDYQDESTVIQNSILSAISGKFGFGV